MCIHVNPLAQQKYAFVPNAPIKIVDISAEKKSLTHVINPYVYTLGVEHEGVRWSVKRTFKEIRDVHKALKKIVKLELGIDCTYIQK